MIQPKVTILIPHYKTLELTKLCLRLLRKHTQQDKIKVIVIDNDSQDASVPYLKSLKWIELIERQSIPDEGAISAHSRALDLALERVTTPYVLSIHTDTLVKHPQWLEFLLSEIERNPQIAGVGSWKLEYKPFWRRILKTLERYFQLAFYTVFRKQQHGIVGVGENYYYLRSHCALYRMDLLRKLDLNFSYENKVACKGMHKALKEHGYTMTFLPSHVLIDYLEHINHATTVLNPALSSRQKSVIKGLSRIEKSLMRFRAKQILEDSSLDN